MNRQQRAFVQVDGSVQRRQQTAPSKCADIIESSLQRLGFDRVARHLTLLHAWDRVIAGRIKERAYVENFRGGYLYLCVDDPIWLHELHMLRHTLKTTLNAEVGEPVVSEIVLRIGRTHRCVPAGHPHRGRRKTQAMSPAVEAHIATLLSPLKDLPCCDALQRLLQRWASQARDTDD